MSHAQSLIYPHSLVKRHVIILSRPLIYRPLESLLCQVCPEMRGTVAECLSMRFNRGHACILASCVYMYIKELCTQLLSQLMHSFDEFNVPYQSGLDTHQGRIIFPSCIVFNQI